MMVLQKALACLDEAKFDEFFLILDKALGKNFQLAELKKQFVASKDDANFYQKLRVFAQDTLAALPTAHTFLTDFIKPTDFVGRQDELEQLHTLLEAGKKSVIVNGLGGVGKTTLARQYAWAYRTHYHHIIWLEQQNTLLAAFVNNNRLNEQMYFTNEDEKMRLDRLMRSLEDTTGKNLLVIDNYESTETDAQIEILQQFQKAQFAHWCVLFTSREQVRDFETIYLETLPTEKAIELFELHSGNKPFEENVLIALLEEVGYHTLTIELLAKTYANNFDIENLQDLLVLMQQKDFDNALLQEMVDTTHHKGYEPLYKHLLLLFDLENFTEEETYLLKQFAVLPTLPIKAKQLLDWLQDDKRIYKNTLQNLARKGWLTTKDQQHYEMHRLLKVLIQKKMGVMWEDVKVMVESVKEELNFDKVNKNPLGLSWGIEYLEYFIKNINFKNTKIYMIFLKHNLSWLCYANGILNKSYIYYKEILFFLKNTNYYNTKYYADILNDFGINCNRLGKYEKTKKNYLKSLYIYKNTIGIENKEYSDCLHNLATLYRHTNNYKKSIILNKKCINIRNKIFGNNNYIYAMSLHNLAVVYYCIEEYEKSKKLYIKSLKIFKNTITKNHPFYAHSLLNLGAVYYDLQNYQQAVNLIQNAYTILLKILGNEHTDTKTCKEWLKVTQKALQNQNNKPS